MSDVRLADTHCHLDFPEFDSDRDDVIARAREKGIDFIINIGSSIRGSRASLDLAAKFDCVYATVGLHPHEADSFSPEWESAIRQLATHKKVVAVGEIGLDFFKNYSKPQNQAPMFSKMLAIAKELSLPVVIHSRQAESQILRLLKENLPVGDVVHCFSGDEGFMRACLDMGFFISFTCNITYKKADNLRSLIKAMPLERLFLETDAPYLPPEGLRGKRNEPLNVMVLAEEIAKIRGCTVQEIARVTTDNAKRFFNIP